MRRHSTGRVLLSIAALAVVTTAAPVLVPQAAAEPSWRTALWSEPGTTAFIGLLAGPATLHVTDFQCPGDRFTILIDAEPIGSTSPLPPSDTECVPATPDQACDRTDFSGGSFALPPGNHQVEIRHQSGLPSGFVAFRVGGAACNTPRSDTDRGMPVGLSPQCIESDIVQELAPSARVGDVVSGPPDRILIMTGGPSCTYNCLDGFDMDCDGTIGDFCPAGLDRNLVSDVRPCLEAVAAARARPLGAEGVQADMIGE